MAAKIPPFIPFSASAIRSLQERRSVPVNYEFTEIKSTTRIEGPVPPNSSCELPTADSVPVAPIYINKKTGAVTLEPAQATAIAFGALKGLQRYGFSEKQALTWTAAPSSEGIVYIWVLLSPEQQQLVLAEFERIKKEMF